MDRKKFRISGIYDMVFDKGTGVVERIFDEKVPAAILKSLEFGKRHPIPN